MVHSIEKSSSSTNESFQVPWNVVTTSYKDDNESIVDGPNNTGVLSRFPVHELARGSSVVVGRVVFVLASYYRNFLTYTGLVQILILNHCASIIVLTQ